MVNFREIALALRCIKATNNDLTPDQRFKMELAATALCGLERLKCNLVASVAPNSDEADSEAETMRLAHDFVSLMGLSSSPDDAEDNGI